MHCYNRSTVTADELASPESIDRFHATVRSTLRRYPLSTVLEWRSQDLEYIRSAGVEAGAIEQIKADFGIDTFDMALIDGSEFAAEAEFRRLRGTRLFLLDDTNSFKCHAVRQALLNDPMYDVVVDDQKGRNGFAIFRRRTSPRQTVDTPVARFLRWISRARQAAEIR